MKYRPLPSIPPTALIPLKEVSGGLLEGGEMKDDRYRKFRQDIYEMSGIGKDSLFDLMDSMMTTKTADGLGDFYLSQFYRAYLVSFGKTLTASEF